MVKKQENEIDSKDYIKNELIKFVNENNGNFVDLYDGESCLVLDSGAYSKFNTLIERKKYFLPEICKKLGATTVVEKASIKKCSKCEEFFIFEDNTFGRGKTPICLDCLKELEKNEFLQLIRKRRNRKTNLLLPDVVASLFEKFGIRKIESDCNYQRDRIGEVEDSWNIVYVETNNSFSSYAI